MSSEQISGSYEFKQEYDNLKNVQEKATEQSTLNFNKKRGINAEMKQFREQKDEFERYQTLTKQLKNQILSSILWNLFHIENKFNNHEDKITEEKSKSEDDKTKYLQLESDYKEARKEQAKELKNQTKLEHSLKSEEGILQKLVFFKKLSFRNQNHFYYQKKSNIRIKKIRLLLIL